MYDSRGLIYTTTRALLPHYVQFRSSLSSSSSSTVFGSCRSLQSSPRCRSLQPSPRCVELKSTPRHGRAFDSVPGLGSATVDATHVATVGCSVHCSPYTPYTTHTHTTTTTTRTAATTDADNNSVLCIYCLFYVPEPSWLLDPRPCLQKANFLFLTPLLHSTKYTNKPTSTIPYHTEYWSCCGELRLRSGTVQLTWSEFLYHTYKYVSVR